jgi:hypothetical protein
MEFDSINFSVIPNVWSVRIAFIQMTDDEFSDCFSKTEKKLHEKKTKAKAKASFHWNTEIKIIFNFYSDWTSKCRSKFHWVYAHSNQFWNQRILQCFFAWESMANKYAVYNEYEERQTDIGNETQNVDK